MKELLDFWPGAKTYLVLGAAAALWAAGAMGVVPPETVEQGLTVLTIIGGGTIAMKINRLRGMGGGEANLLLVGLISASLLTMGCATVNYDGAGAQEVAEQALARVVGEGAPLSGRDCDPLADFRDRMRDEDGNERIMRWLWTNDDDTEPKLIADLADTQYRGCSILESRAVMGTTADRTRATINDFWTRTGLNVGPGRPEE